MEINQPEVMVEKPRIARVVSGVLFLIAIFYVLKAVFGAGVIVIIDSKMGSGELVFSFLRYFPTFGPIPILYALASLLFFYVALKIQNASKFSFWTAVISIIAVPLPLAFVIRVLLMPLTQLASSVSWEQFEGIASIPMNFQTFSFGDPIFLSSILAILLLIFSYKKFQFINERLTNRAKIFFVLVSIIIVIPIFSIVSMGYIKAQDRDYGYKDAQASVSYHIYKSSLPEKKLTNATIFTTNNDLAGKQNAIKVAYDLPFDQAVRNREDKILSLKQVSVESSFDLKNFIYTEISDPTSVDEISYPSAKNQKAFLVYKSFGKDKLHVYYFSYVTKDDVLIFIASPKVTRNEIIEFADSLK